MRFGKDESGQTLILMALCFTVMAGFLVLSIDMGLMFRAKRQVQIAADAASVAGALDYKYNATVTSAQTGSMNRGGRSLR